MSTEPPARIPELDGLRGLAILLVLAWHYVGTQEWFGPAQPLVERLLALAWTGVDLFFVLSGFLIGGILLAQRDSSTYFTAFYVRRACRIIPAYLVLVVIAFAWDYLKHPGGRGLDPSDRLLPAWSYLTFTQNLLMARAGRFRSAWLAVTWSLAVEEQFYLTLPVLLRLLSPPAAPYVLLPLMLAAPILRALVFALHRHGGFAAYVLMPCRADALLLGVLIAWAWRDTTLQTRCREHQGVLRTLLLLLGMGAAALACVEPGYSSGLMVRAGYSWLALFYGTLLIVVLSQSGRRSVACLRMSWLRGLGAISYGVYLFHPPVRVFAFDCLAARLPPPWGPMLATTAALALTVAAATLSWRLLERPLVTWGHTFAYVERGRPKPGPA